MPAITTFATKAVGLIDVAFRVTLSGTLPTCGTPPVRCADPNVWVAFRGFPGQPYEGVAEWNGPPPGVVQPPTSYDPATGAIVIEFDVALMKFLAPGAEYLVIIQCKECPPDLSTVIVPAPVAPAPPPKAPGPPPKKK